MIRYLAGLVVRCAGWWCVLSQMPITFASVCWCIAGGACFEFARMLEAKL